MVPHPLSGRQPWGPVEPCACTRLFERQGVRLDELLVLVKVAEATKEEEEEELPSYPRPTERALGPVRREGASW